MPDMISTPVVWEEPPAIIRSAGKTSPEAEALRSRPGTWARIYEYPTASSASVCAQTIRRGTRAGFQDGTFEAKARTRDGKGLVFARFVPES